MTHVVRAGLMLLAWMVVSSEAIDKVFILPDVNQTVINSGEDLELECSYTKPVKWLPPETANWNEVNVKYWQDGRYHKASLRISGAVYSDTGYYECLYNSSSGEITSNKIYVYVRDSKNLFVKKMEFEWLTVKQHDDLVIPCRVTSPEVQVVLQKDYVNVMSSSVSYNPAFGFSITDVKLEDVGQYTCIAQLGNGITEESAYSLHVLLHTNSVPKPYMKDATKMHVEVGDTLKLQCWVQIAVGIKFALSWEYPDKRNTTDHVVRIKEQQRKEKEMQDSRTFLVIENVTHADEGQYFCYVKDHNQLQNNVSTHLTVYEKNTTYLNLSLQGNSYSVERQADNTVQWVVYIRAHPEAEIHWYGPDGSEIKNSTAYTVTVEPHVTTLNISTVKIYDTGTYMLSASNNAGTETINVSLTVNDRPMVTVYGKQLYTYNSVEEIDCSIVGYPEPSVKWLHRECRVPLECYNLPFIEYDTSSYTSLKMHNKSFWRSTLIVPAANESGQIACFAENGEGSTNETINFIVTDVPYDEEIWLTIDGETYNSSQQPVELDIVTLHCGVPVANYTSKVLWFKGSNLMKNTSEYTILNTSTEYSYRSSILFHHILKKHNGAYMCEVTKYDDDETISVPFQFSVRDLQPPVIYETNMRNTNNWDIIEGEKVSWTCKVRGSPKPKVKWYKDNKPFTIRVNDTERITLSPDNFTLKITVVRESDSGTYKCEARNTADVVFETATLKIKDKRNTTGLIIGIVILAIIFLVAVMVFAYKIREAQRFKRELIAAGLNHFEEGAMDNFNHELPIDEQAELLPYDKKWEFPRDKLKLGRQLGAGAFGVVRKAEAWGIVEGEAVTTVAVKMVKSADFAYIKALASELKIMLHLGKHLNVVNLLGACTKDLNKKEFLVIVEFCRYGNLHNYLMRHRDRFIDQIDPNTGRIDYAIGNDLSRSLSLSSNKAKVKYAALSFSNLSGSGLSPGGDYDAEPSSPAPRSPGADSDMTVCMTPTAGDEESPMLSNNSSVQPGWRSNFRGDYKPGKVRAIFTRDLLCWAFQVARGMEYLAGRKVMHGDMAARNILLADDNIVKICDFGLAKSMYKSDNYKKKGDAGRFHWRRKDGHHIWRSNEGRRQRSRLPRGKTN